MINPFKGQLVTNQTLLAKDIQTKDFELRKYRVIACEEGHVWVKALNGQYAGEYLTFTFEALYDFNSSNAELQAKLRSLNVQQHQPQGSLGTRTREDGFPYG